MGWDDDSDFADDDFDNTPQGFRDYDDDWGSSHDAWEGKPRSEPADDGWVDDDRDIFDADDDAAFGDEVNSITAGTNEEWNEHQEWVAEQMEDFDADKDAFDRIVAGQFDDDDGAAMVNAELTELQLDNAEREAQRFDFQDEQGDPEDEADARDEHDGFWGGLWNRFSK